MQHWRWGVIRRATSGRRRRHTQRRAPPTASGKRTFQQAYAAKVQLFAAEIWRRDSQQSTPFFTYSLLRAQPELMQKKLSWRQRHHQPHETSSLACQSPPRRQFHSKKFSWRQRHHQAHETSSLACQSPPRRQFHSKGRLIGLSVTGVRHWPHSCPFSQERASRSRL